MKVTSMAHDFLPMLKKDMSEARLRITISSPRLKKSRTISMMNYLHGLTLSSENITIITKPTSEYKSSEVDMVKELLNQLALAGFTVIVRPNVLMPIFWLCRCLIEITSI